jgi:quinoprotein glucose dehydrogenase
LRLSAASLALLIAACAHAPTPAEVAADTSVAAEPVPGSSFDHVGWDSYLGGGDSSQYSSLAQIDRTNVARLQPAWTFETGSAQPPRFNPIVVNGIMYVVADNVLVALDAATGKEVWRRPNEGRVGSRGINYWQSEDGNDRRLLYINDGMLRAVAADTGEPIGAFGDGGRVDLRVGLQGDISAIRPLQTDNPGRVFENLIIISLHTGAYDYASSPGDIHAYDVRTGALVWVFHTVPRVGEFGSDSWPDKDREKFGGVHNWSESTVDRELGIVYIPTGTARFDFYGGNRPGDNLFANSILALDARTGRRIWHYQTIHHDLWDLDLPAAPKLLTLRRDGKDIPVVVQPTKHGYLFVLDRRTGEPIWPIEERPVPASDVPGEKASPTQPFPTWPPPYTRDKFTEADINPYIPEADRKRVRELLRTVRNEGPFTPPSLQGTISLPGHNGGANWGNVAVDPLNQRLFVVARVIPTLLKLIPDRRPDAAAKMPNAGPGVLAYRSPVDFMMQTNGMSAIGPPWSTITAYDMNSGNILWQVPNGEIMTLAAKGITGTGSQAPRGGPVATAGGLLFVGTATDRKFRARDAATGEVLWEHDLPAATEGVPAVYEAGGRQFVVIAVGGHGHFANGLGLPEPGPNQYMAFALPTGTGN